MNRTNRHKLFAILLSACLIVSLLPAVVFAAGSMTGTGTEEDPYLIYDAADLTEFCDMVNAGETQICGMLMADIVLNENFDQAKIAIDNGGNVTYDGGSVPDEFTVWAPIGNSRDNMYSGIFDGNGYVISGIFINNSGSDYKGLFGFIGGTGVVKNIGIINGFIKGRQYCAGVTGYNYGIIENSCNMNVATGEGMVGGLVGTNYGSVVNSCNTGYIRGGNYTGGVVGSNGGSIKNSCNLGDVTSEESFLGGVAGYNFDSIENSYNTGDVSGIDYVGGVTGSNNSKARIENSYNTGNVSGNDVVGGIVGRDYNGSIKNNYNIGKVSNIGKAGGIVGYDEKGNLTVENSFYLNGSSPDNGYGVAKTENEFSQQSTFNNWDFDTVWTMSEDLGRPVLQAIPEELSILSVICTTAQSEYEVSINLSEPIENGILIAALYDEQGRMISCSTTAANGNSEYLLNITSSENGSYIKTFVFNSLNSVKPLCKNKVTQL